MEELKALLEEAINENLQNLILSNPSWPELGSKASARPLRLKSGMCFQVTLYRDNKVFHYNADREETVERLLALLRERRLESGGPDQ